MKWGKACIERLLVPTFPLNRRKTRKIPSLQPDQNGIVSTSDLEQQNVQLAHKFASAQEKIEEMRRKLNSQKSTSPTNQGISAPSGHNDVAKDELRELLLRRLRGNERNQEPSASRASAIPSSLPAMTVPFNHAPLARTSSPDVASLRRSTESERGDEQRAAGWDEKLKTLQNEKGQLEKALLERDAELAALRQKENSLSVGCDK